MILHKPLRCRPNPNTQHVPPCWKRNGGSTTKATSSPTPTVTSTQDAKEFISRIFFSHQGGDLDLSWLTTTGAYWRRKEEREVLVLGWCLLLFLLYALKSVICLYFHIHILKKLELISFKNVFMIFSETIKFGNNILLQSNIRQKDLKQIFEWLSPLLSAWDMELLISFKSNLLIMGNYLFCV